ncbi:MAG TPA: glycosyltransferase family 4 protein, partial [Clostridia bacterium]|nr:glycosyltransferase family 4 protein [Clostridia bacterium]
MKPGKSPIKVCMLTSVHCCTDVRIYHKQARTLAQNGYSVAIIAPDSIPEDELGINFIPFSRPEGKIKRILFSSRRIFKIALEQNADIYHLHDPELLIAGLKLKKRGKTVIFDSHEDIEKQILNKYWIKPFLRKLTAFLFDKLCRYCTRRFDLVIAATESIEERYKRYGCKTGTVKNYPIIKEFDIINTIWEDRRNSFCYIGGIMKIRGIAQMLDALSYTSADMELAGRFDNSALENITKSHPNWARVTYHGFVGRIGVADILARVKIGAVILHPVPNYIDSLPIKMFEYMAAGIPVIASDFPLFRQILHDNACGICVDPFNAEEIGNTIDKLLHDDDLARTMGENGKRAVKE